MSESTSTTIKALKFEKIDLASRDPGKLAEFYNQVFGIEFTALTHSNMTHYSGDMGGVELFLCPNEPAG